MPFSKNLNKYPPHLFALAELRDTDLPHMMTFASEQTARAFRMKVYGFTEALRSVNHPYTPRMDALLIQVRGASVILSLRDSYVEGAMQEVLDIVAQRGAAPIEAQVEFKETIELKPSKASEDLIARLYGAAKKDSGENEANETKEEKQNGPDHRAVDSGNSVPDGLPGEKEK